MNRPRLRPNIGGEATRAALIAAAERLFAERGIEGVSLREIGAAAGQRNTNVTQYHFGDRENLVRAIVLSRAAPSNEQRMALLDSADDSPDALARALVEPLAAHLDGRGHYLSFLFQLLVSSEGRVPFVADLADEATSSFRELVRRLRRALPDLSPAVVRQRAEMAADFVVVTLAAREKGERRRGKGLMARDAFVAEVVRATAGILGTAC